MKNEKNTTTNTTTLETLKAELAVADSEQSALSAKKRNLKKQIQELEAESIPATEESKTPEAPVAEEPKVPETPVAEELKAPEAPVAEEPKAPEAPVAEEPKVPETPVAKDVEDDDWLDKLIAEEKMKKSSSKDKKEVSETKVSKEMNNFGTFEEKKATPSKDKKSIGFIILISVLVIGLIAIIIAAGVNKSTSTTDAPATDAPATDAPATDAPATDAPATDAPETDAPATDAPATDAPATDAPATDTSFDLNSFIKSIVSISEKEYGAENIEANVNIFVKMVGEDELKELIEKHSEITVKKSIAEFLIYAPEVKMKEYANANGLKYNPSAEADCEAKLQEISKKYTDATGKDPNEVLMSKTWYNDLKTSQKLVKSKLLEENDKLLLDWYTARADAYSLMYDQISDTEKALDYRDSVILEIVSSEGAIDLWKLQLEKEAKGELIVVDNTTKNFTDAYKAFIVNNYIYVVA